MAAPSVIERLLASAEDLSQSKGISAAYRRRAVSSAYYAVIKAIGLIVVFLQAERQRADYSPPDKDMFRLSEVVEIILKARLVVSALDELGKADRRLLATCLLFKDRKS